jgi:hypothetical protein
MPAEPTILRAAMAQAARVLADEQLDLAEQVRQARALLVAALEATAALSPAERAALDADPAVQAALARPRRRRRGVSARRAGRRPDGRAAGVYRR